MNVNTQVNDEHDATPEGTSTGAVPGAHPGGVGGTPGYLFRTAADAEVMEPAPGITARLLWTGENGAKAMVVEFAPGSCWDGIDVHEPGPEEVYVVSGTFHDGDRDHPAGTFLHAPAGSWHVPQSAAGCTLFVFYPEG
ncbi:cupin domain-containing protein [Streptomyces sp. BBFR2]|uniref:cupin domain-containing protein n=1 Tax=Streptomyces sp. BBFR2 TaxID=3372854 RepID=UPI0037D9D9B9